MMGIDETAYAEGIAAHPEQDCPYSMQEMREWSAWWAGWNDCDRGLA